MLTKERVQEIKSIADRLLNKSLNEIAKENDISVITGILPKMGDKNISGAILRGSDGKYTIYINSNDLELRRRFTFAHELGHFFLHKELLDKNSGIIDKSEKYLYRDEEYENLSDEIKNIEYEANEFAGALLMPEEVVLKYKDSIPVSELAKVFEVSELALTVRIYNLTVRKYD